MFLNNLGNWLGTRFKIYGSEGDLARAIQVATTAVGTTPQEHPDRIMHMNNLGNWLATRFDKNQSFLDDIDRAVEIAKATVQATPENDPARAGYLMNHGNRLVKRSMRTNSLDDLHHAVKLLESATESTPQGHSEEGLRLNTLAACLDSRFKRTGEVDDLNCAINAADKAVESCAPGTSGHRMCMNTLGSLLETRSQRTGSREDLHRAISLTSELIDNTPQDHPDWAGHMNNASNRLGRQYMQTASTDDLNRAITVADMAVEATPPGPNRARWLNNLGNWLGRRYEHAGSIADIKRAVEVAKLAVESAPEEHPDRSVYWNSLSCWLGKQFEQTEMMIDINQAVQSAWLNNLGSRLATRYKWTKFEGDLDRSIEVGKMAIDAIPHNHPNRAAGLINLGLHFSSRFELAKMDQIDSRKSVQSTNDLDLALSCYEQAWNCQTSPPRHRISAAEQASVILASNSKWLEASEFMEGAVRLLPILSPRLLDNSDKQAVLKRYNGLESMAAAVALNAAKDVHNALELLELGRCVIAGLLMEMRTDISELKVRHPELAAQFISLRNELDSPSNSTGNLDRAWESQTNRRFEAEQAFHSVVTEIRKRTEFERFLLPPSREDLMAAAKSGPVVIVNISSYRCDAFLVERSSIRVVPLPQLKEKEVVRYAQPESIKSTAMLAWLWDVVASPVLAELGYDVCPSDENLPHVWWIPTGALSHFPIHAAGHHIKGSKQTVLDRVMSSYASTLRALVHGRRHQGHTTAEQAILVAMDTTPEKTPLRQATKEVEMIESICQALKLKPIIPAQRRREDVISHLGACKIFHFAGHGMSDLHDPSRSCLLLEDWKSNPFTVADLRDSGTRDRFPFLGYLSACSTGVSKVDTLVDEGIHLVSALQLAGFRHVIGTLRAVYNGCCPDVAKVVYEQLRDEMTDTAVCQGLHRSIKSLRDEYISELADSRDGNRINKAKRVAEQKPLYWVPFIHFGV